MFPDFDIEKIDFTDEDDCHSYESFIKEYDSFMETQFKAQGIQKVYSVLVHKKLMSVYRRPNETHDYGRLNNCDNHLWLKYDAVDEVSNSDVEVRIPSFEWIPWIDLGINRICWDINISQDNKLHKSTIRSFGFARLLCNKKCVFESSFNDLNYIISKIQQLTITMPEHPFNFANIDEEIGRLIWFHKQPAIIESFSNGNVTIKYDGDYDGFNLANPWNNAEDIAEDQSENRIHTSISDKNIYWFRSEDNSKQDGSLTGLIKTKYGSMPQCIYDLAIDDVKRKMLSEYGIRYSYDTVTFLENEKTKISTSVPSKTYLSRIKEFHEDLCKEFTQRNQLNRKLYQDNDGVANDKSI